MGFEWTNPNVISVEQNTRTTSKNTNSSMVDGFQFVQLAKFTTTQ